MRRRRPSKGAYGEDYDGPGSRSAVKTADTAEAAEAAETGDRD